MAERYHEPFSELPTEVRDIHRAIQSLIEELDAVDWYLQRTAVTGDDSLRDVLAHNRDEEMEHACMLIEWLRRHMDGWDEELRTYLFTEGPIEALEEKGEGGGRSSSLGIGRPGAD